MNQHRSFLIYFGPLTVFIEWAGIIIGAFYIHAFTINDAVSTATIAPRPLPFIFGSTLTLAALSYFIFTLSFLEYSLVVPLLGAIGGLAFILTGWIRIPLAPLHGWNGKLHLISITIAVMCYAAIVWFAKNHEIPAVRQASRIIFWLIVSSIVLTGISIFVLHKFLAVMELTILLLAQGWTIYIAWHLRLKKLSKN